MSKENVELVRKMLDAWNQRDADRWLSYAAADIEWVPAGPAAVEAAVYRGHDQVASGIAAVWETWEVFAFRDGELRDLGESVLWLGRARMRGSASGIELDQEFALHGVARAGRVVKVHTFLTRRDALDALGLVE